LGLQSRNFLISDRQSSVVIDVAQILSFVHDIHKAGHALLRGYAGHGNLLLNHFSHALALASRASSSSGSARAVVGGSSAIFCAIPLGG
jgi:hypothetical protein